MNNLFSIIIPTFNRIDQLKLCLKSINNIHVTDFSYEIIVIDDSSTDSTTVYLSEIKENNFTFLRNRSKGPSAARNMGAQKASGKYLVFLDDDCTVPSDWLIKYNNLLKTFTDCVIGGSVLDATGHPISRVMEFVTLFHETDLNKISGKAQFLTSNNLLCDRSVFLQSGGFDESFGFAGGEDREFIYRLIANNTKVFFQSEIQIYHHHRLNVKRFIRQQFNYGRGAFLLRKKTDIQKDENPFALGFIILLRMFRAAFNSKGFLKGLFYSLIILLSQIFVTIGYTAHKLSSKHYSHKGS